MLEEVCEKEWMQEVHEAVAFVQPRSRVDRQVQPVVSAFVGLVYLLSQLFARVLVWDVAHHHVRALVVAHPNPVYVLLANHRRLRAVRHLRGTWSRVLRRRVNWRGHRRALVRISAVRIVLLVEITAGARIRLLNLVLLEHELHLRGENLRLNSLLKASNF